MDNLTHSCVAMGVQGLIAHKVPKKYFMRLSAASICIANMPDVDILLSIFGETFYHFHHRGFTHSAAGLVLIVPLCYFLTHKILGVEFKEERASGGFEFGKLKILQLVLIQLFFSHYFLDYLTSYGMMLGYPFSFDRFKFPLMFIIDPLLWVISGSYVIYAVKHRGLSLKSSTGFVFVLIAFWVMTYQVKNIAYRVASEIDTIRNPNSSEIAKIEVFPGPGAPLFWQWYSNKSGEYGYGSLSLFRTPVKHQYNSLSSKIYKPGLCQEFSSQENSRMLFKKYEQFAEAVLCHRYSFKELSGCRCVNLKYGSPLWEEVPFGSFIFSESGEHHFLTPDDPRKMLGSLMKLY